MIRALKSFKLYVVPKPEGDENSATEITNRVLAWQASRQPRPFFAFLNYFDAHSPYKPLPKWRQKFTNSPKSKDLYESDIAYVDEEIGRLLSTLEKRGALANTLVVITADHGEQFGEHKLFGHGNSVYLPLLHVPLVMVQPGRIPADVRVERVVSLRDLTETIAAQTGRDTTPHFPGTSLAAFWRDSAATGSAVLAELFRSEFPTATNSFDRSRQYALLDDAWHYVWRPAAKPELYVYRRDLKETVSRADSLDGKAIANAMHQRLVDQIRGDTLSFKRTGSGVAKDDRLGRKTQKATPATP